MHKSTRYGYSVLKSYFERFFTVKYTTRTTGGSRARAARAEKTHQPSNTIIREGGCGRVFPSLLFSAHLIKCAQLVN
jgi:hypothetical protein